MSNDSSLHSRKVVTLNYLRRGGDILTQSSVKRQNIILQCGRRVQLYNKTLVAKFCHYVDKYFQNWADVLDFHLCLYPKT